MALELPASRSSAHRTPFSGVRSSWLTRVRKVVLTCSNLAAAARRPGGPLGVAPRRDVAKGDCHAVVDRGHRVLDPALDPLASQPVFMTNAVSPVFQYRRPAFQQSVVSGVRNSLSRLRPIRASALSPSILSPAGLILIQRKSSNPAGGVAHGAQHRYTVQCRVHDTGREPFPAPCAGGAQDAGRSRRPDANATRLPDRGHDTRCAGHFPAFANLSCKMRRSLHKPINIGLRSRLPDHRQQGSGH